MQIPLQILQAEVNRQAQVWPFDGMVLETVAKGITPAQLNAGYDLIGNFQSNAKLKVVGFLIIVNSATIGAVTDIRLRYKNSTNTVIATILQAVLTSGSKHTPLGGLNGTTPSAVALGAGFGAVTTPGRGVELVKTGSDATGAFTIDVMVLYSIRG